MATAKILSVITLLLSAANVAAHGHVDWLITNGVAYRGYDAPSMSLVSHISSLAIQVSNEKKDGIPTLIR